MERIRVLFVTDSPLFADAAGFLLSRDGPVDYLGHISLTLEDLCRPDHQPADVVLVYAEEPAPTPVEVTRRLRKRLPHAQIVVVVDTVHHGDSIPRLVEAGASGYVPQSAPLGEMLATVQAVHLGDGRFSGPVARAILSRIRELSRSVAGQPASRPRLTSREQEVLQLIAAGLANKEIARDLGITLSTVKNHVHNIFDKLGVTSRREAVSHALRTNILDGTLPV